MRSTGYGESEGVRPGLMTISTGVKTLKRSHGGVITSELRASPKNAKTSPIGLGDHTSRLQTRTLILRIRDLL